MTLGHATDRGRLAHRPGAGTALGRPPEAAAICSEPRRAIGDACRAGSSVKVGYVVLYVDDADACQRFWLDQVGMVEKARTQVGDVSISQVGFADQDFAFELVPLALMRDNPDGLDLATPSIAFRVADLEATHTALAERGVQTSEVGVQDGIRSFAFADPEGRWFAVTQ